MNWRVGAVLLMLVLLGQGCSRYSEERVYKAVHEKLVGLESYSCTADIYVKGNKQPGQFKIKQWFRVPGMYRLEVLEPAVMQGKTTVFDGSRIWVYYPYIDQVVLLENAASETDENLFLGFFLRDMLETEDIRCSFGQLDKAEVLVIELPVPGSSKYRSVQRLFVNRKDLRPLRLEMYDIKGEVTARVDFSDFQFNPKLDDDFFDKDKIGISMFYEDWDPSGMFFGSIEEAGEYLDFSPLWMYYLPEGFTNEVIQVVENGGKKALIAAYSSDDKNLVLLQKTMGRGEGDLFQSGELIYLDDKPAFYSERQGVRKISWTEGNIRVQLVGNLTRRTLADIARNIK
ncbi:MAG TPA: outer-membrane lipoprotein carrier protein LolA [Bacillota bacterium]|nr:outer-membrane lipoprotein carrier protein LolA [Bacillota bacterium]